MTTIHLLVCSHGCSLQERELCSGVLNREIKSRNSSRCQGVEEIQALHPGEPGRLSKGEAFFAKVMNGGHQTYLLGKLPGLFAESEEKLVGNFYRDVRRSVFSPSAEPKPMSETSQETL